METLGTKERIFAIIRLVVPVVVSIAAGFGLAIDANLAYIIATCVLALAAFLWSWWKNNNLTTAAIYAQEILEDFKRPEIELDDKTRAEIEDAVEKEYRGQGGA